MPETHSPCSFWHFVSASPVQAGIQHLLEAREEDRFEEIRCKSGCGLLWIEGDLGSGELARRSSQIPSLALQIISQHS